MFFHEPEIQIKDKYLESSIFVLSSRFEGFGMVIIEAMSCGLPVVSFNCNYGPSDIVRNGEDGFLVEAGDLKEFANKISALIADEDLRKRMGGAAKQNVKRFSANEVVAQWDSLFKELVS